jgi:ribosomal protein L7Ae-like RNA K-turn-binding protein
MTKNKTIVLLHSDDTYECYATLTALCRAKGWSYNYLKKKKLPFVYRGIKVLRLPYLS